MAFTLTRFALVLLLAGLLIACAGAPVDGVTEKPINSVSEIQGVWKGKLFNGNAMEVRVKPDGSWSNKAENMGYFEGTATAANGIIKAKSNTTGREYVWRLYEGKSAGGAKRVLTWTSGGRRMATLEFAGIR
jgi:hypothetical protein